MTINFLDLYNDVASQPWSMFDYGAETSSDLEPALVSSINKAIIDIWYSYPFSFRLKKYNLITNPRYNSYNIPDGNILNESSIEDNLFAITIDGKHLSYNPELKEDRKLGTPKEFTISDDEIILSPVPDRRYQVSIKYLTLSIGFNEDDEEIFYLENPTDYIDIPLKYESIFKNAVKAKAMLESLVSTGDENYLGYKIQFDKAYKLLIKVTNPVKKSMYISI